MKKLTLKYNKDPWTDSKISNGTLSGDYFEALSLSELNNVLKSHGPKLRNFKSSGHEIENLDKVLEKMPLLETLDLSKATILSMKPVDLPNLKTLKIQNDMLPFIKKTDKLTTLEVTKVGEFPMILIEFIRNLSALTSLKIKNMFHSDRRMNYFLNEFNDVTFKLQSLAIEELYLIIPNEEIFTRYLTLHQASLKHLTLLLGADGVTTFVFTQLPKLESLELHVGSVTGNTEFYSYVSPSDTIKRIKLHEKFDKHGHARKFFENFPALEELDLTKVQHSIWSSKFLKTLASLHKNLKHLAIPVMFKGTSRNLRFKNLKSFHLGSIYTSEILLNFLANHHELENLWLSDKFEEGKLSTEDFEKLLRYLPNLRHIHYQARMASVKKFYDVLRKDFRNLETISLGVLYPSKRLILRSLDPKIIKFVLSNEKKYRQLHRFDAVVNALLKKFPINAPAEKKI